MTGTIPTTLLSFMNLPPGMKLSGSYTLTMLAPQLVLKAVVDLDWQGYKMITVFGLQKLGFTPLVDFELEGIGDGVQITKWLSDSPQPSEAEIETAHAEWQAEYDSQEYARNRKAEYPTTDELIVALWENVVEERAQSVVALEGKRQTIKTKYPKP